MTRDEERLVEQRTRIREARFMLRSVADDAGLSITPELEAELRTIARRLQSIEENVLAVMMRNMMRKARVVNTDQMRISTAPMKPEDEKTR